jgi:hypothetical protein
MKLEHHCVRLDTLADEVRSISPSKTDNEDYIEKYNFFVEALNDMIYNHFGTDIAIEFEKRCEQ